MKAIVKKGDTVLLECDLDFPVSVGRDPANALSIPNKMVSGSHAVLEWDGTHLTFRDLGSTNGTFYHGQRVTLQKCALPAEFNLGGEITLQIRREETEILKTPPRYTKAPPKTWSHSQAAPAAQEAPAANVSSEFDAARGWQMAKVFQIQHLAYALIALTLAFMVFHGLLVREGLGSAISYGIGTLITAVFMAVLVAGLAAIPGFFIRKSYDFRPLFVSNCFAIFFGITVAIVLKPGAMLPGIGLLVKILAIPLAIAVSVAGSYLFLFNTFPHKWGKNLLAAACVCGLIGSTFTIRDLLKFDQRGVAKEAVFGGFSSARATAGDSVPVKALTDEIRGFTAELRLPASPRGPSSESQP